jgi:hypothetical protein
MSNKEKQGDSVINLQKSIDIATKRQYTIVILSNNAKYKTGI